ncbi:unnamed protein product [Prunus brigantina]
MLPDPREGPYFAQSTPLCDEPPGFERHQFESCQSPVIAQIEQPVVVVFPAASNTIPSSVKKKVDMVAAQSWSDEEDGFTPWWMGFSFYGCPMFVLSSKLRALKAKLKEWNWREFGDINVKVNDSMRALESIQTEIANLGPSDERFLREDQKMFTADAEVVNTGLVERVIPSLVTAGDNMLLTSIPSQEEIFGVVKSMDSLSSPGPDGFGGIFFLHCWSVVVPGADTVSQLRPVALANFVFKIITKILANRSMNLLDRKCKGGNVAIKFDIQKAFDTLDWGFILRVLTAFGFGEVFGDPFSPILFCLAQEVFSRGISSLIESGAMRRINAPRGVTPPSHVLFADDIMVFIQGTTKNLRVLMRFMAEYGLNSAVFIRARFLAKGSFTPQIYRKSSIWLGLKKLLPQILENSQWVIGNGSQVDFWTDNWMGDSLMHLLGIPPSVAFSFHAKVADFINNCRWDLPVNFVRAFPHLAASIEAIVLPIEPCADHLIWTGAMSGILSAKEAYLWLSSHNASVPWSKVIWDKALQPRKSLVVWKALQSRLLTDEFLQKRGVSLVSCCSFCYRYGETVNHLFLTCPFVMALWKWLIQLFNKSSCPFDSMDNFFVGICECLLRLWSFSFISTDIPTFGFFASHFVHPQVYSCVVVSSPYWLG